MRADGAGNACYPTVESLVILFGSDPLIGRVEPSGAGASVGRPGWLVDICR